MMRPDENPVQHDDQNNQHADCEASFQRTELGEVFFHQFASSVCASNRLTLHVTTLLFWVYLRSSPLSAENTGLSLKATVCKALLKLIRPVICSGVAVPARVSFCPLEKENRCNGIPSGNCSATTFHQSTA